MKGSRTIETKYSIETNAFPIAVPSRRSSMITYKQPFFLGLFKVIKDMPPKSSEYCSG